MVSMFTWVSSSWQVKNLTADEFLMKTARAWPFCGLVTTYTRVGVPWVLTQSTSTLVPMPGEPRCPTGGAAALSKAQDSSRTVSRRCPSCVIRLPPQIR